MIGYPAECDVAIVGAGPAGSATAIELRRQGYRVALIERSDFRQPRIGETLPPHAMATLADLGCLERFLSDGHASSPGVVSLWGDAEPYENDFLFSPYGQGWHLDRARFDEMLCSAAADARADCMRQTTVRSVAMRETEARLHCLTAGKEWQLSTRFVIDATGQAASLARMLGSKALVHDQLAVTYATCAAGARADWRTYVEAVEQGWWYAARLPDGQVIVAYLTSLDLLSHGQERDVWLRSLQDTELISGLINPAFVSPLRMKVARVARLSRFSGAGWLAAGDAALSFDPLSSAGIWKSLESGRQAAQATIANLNESAHSLADYDQSCAAAFAAHLRDRDYYYSQVRRWSGSPFWTARQSNQAPLAAVAT